MKADEGSAGLDIFFDISLYGYLLATVLYAVWFFWRGPKLWVAGTAVLCLSLVSQVVYIIVKTVSGGRPPLANTFETLVFFAACVTVLFLVTVKTYGWKSMAPLAALAALFVTLFAFMIRPEGVEPILPALRDNFWLTVHVVICFVSYAAFLLAYLGALTFLVKSDRHAAPAGYMVSLTMTGLVAAVVIVILSNTTLWTGVVSEEELRRAQAHGTEAEPRSYRTAILFGASGGAVVLAALLWPLLILADRELRLRERLPEKAQLQRMVYKSVALGFPFLSLGIITGSVWASQAWGRYWGWDPKEVASLITWLVFAIYLHLRLVPKWRGPWVAWVAVGGFWCVLFTYFGVNYLLSGLHAYVG